MKKFLKIRSKPSQITIYGRPAMINRISIAVISLAFLFSACATESTTPYIPPSGPENPRTLSTQSNELQNPLNQQIPTVSSQSTPFILDPLIQANCFDGLSFVDDLTIPDGSLVSPLETIDKRWMVENSGSCNWNRLYRLRLISGPELSAPIEQALYPARSGSMAIIRILFTAPAEQGTYRSAWQAYNPAGEAFGDPIFIEIVVSP